MKYIKRVSFILIILSFLFLIGCNNKKDYLSYRIDDKQLIVIIDDLEYNVGEVEYNSKDLKIKDAYDFYKAAYPEYIGTKEQFKTDVIKNRLYYGEAVLTVTYNINETKKESLFYRGDNLTFPKVSSKEYLILGWIYNIEAVDENYIVVDDMTIDAIVEKYVNVSINIEGMGSAKLDKSKVLKGDKVKLIYEPDFGYTFLGATYNGESLTLSSDNTFEIIDDSNVDIKVIFEVEELSMPIMNITLPTALENVGKIDYVNAKMSISNTDEKYAAKREEMQNRAERKAEYVL